jgi:hypothetical protein
MFLLSRRDSSGWAKWGLVRARRLCFLCLGWMEHGAIWAGVFVGRGRGEDGGSRFDLASGRLHVCPFPPSGATKSCYFVSSEPCDSPDYFFFSRKHSVCFSCHIRTGQRRRDNGLYTMRIFWVRRRGASSPRGDTMVRDSQLGRTPIITIPCSFLLITNERSSSSSSGAAVWCCVTLSNVSCALVSEVCEVGFESWG